MASFGYFYLCLLPQYVLGYWVKGSTTGARYGQEIPACFFFQAHIKGIEWIKKKIGEAEKKVQARFETMKEKCCSGQFFVVTVLLPI